MFKANENQRVPQRFIHPHYKKDNLGNILFSSTITFAEFRGQPLIILAAHAIDRGESFDSLGVFLDSGEYSPLSKFVHDYHIFPDDDLIICKAIGFFDKNHFDLIFDNNLNYDEGSHWVGFPAKKAIQTFHRSRTDESIKSSVSTILDDGRIKRIGAEFLNIELSDVNRTIQYIDAHFSNKEVKYLHEGHKDHGYSLKGMSGGPIYIISRSNGEILNKNHLQLIGIGLSYDEKSERAKGASRERIISLIKNIL